MTQIDVQTETENAQAKCWDYMVLVHHESGQTTEHRVRLSWLDHEHWSGGRTAPSKVVQCVVERLVARGLNGGLPEKFDAAKARRWFPGIDQELREQF